MFLVSLLCISFEQTLEASCHCYQYYIQKDEDSCKSEVAQEFFISVH